MLQNNQTLIRIRIFLYAIIMVAVIIFLSVYLVPFVQDLTIFFSPSNSRYVALTNDSIINIQSIANTQKNIKKYQQKLLKKTPISGYLVVNTSENHFYLFKNRKMIREGLCSTGSYIKLETETEQKWIFKTPRGEFRIRGKTTFPVWKKPDWAFIEEGLPVPSPDHPSRYEYGSLGDYALSLGYGYLVHGTLYQRFLGMPVTHGCIRLGDNDLKAVYNNLEIGSKVYIF
jgi:hypothetical protein